MHRDAHTHLYVCYSCLTPRCIPTDTSSVCVLVCISVVNMHGCLIHNEAGNQAVHLCMTLRNTPLITHTLFDIQIQLSVFIKEYNCTHGSWKCHRSAHRYARIRMIVHVNEKLIVSKRTHTTCLCKCMQINKVKSNNKGTFP